MSVGIVKSISGVATLTRANGAKAALRAGETLELGDIIKTDENSSVQITLESGKEITLASNDTLKIDDAVAVTESFGDEAVADVTALQQGLLNGEDLSDLEATAAGGGAGAGGGDGVSLAAASFAQGGHESNVLSAISSLGATSQNGFAGATNVAAGDGAFTAAATDNTTPVSPVTPVTPVNPPVPPVTPVDPNNNNNNSNNNNNNGNNDNDNGGNNNNGGNITPPVPPVPSVNHDHTATVTVPEITATTPNTETKRITASIDGGLKDGESITNPKFVIDGVAKDASYNETTKEYYVDVPAGDLRKDVDKKIEFTADVNVDGKKAGDTNGESPVYNAPDYVPPVNHDHTATVTVPEITATTPNTETKRITASIDGGLKDGESITNPKFVIDGVAKDASYNETTKEYYVDVPAGDLRKDVDKKIEFTADVNVDGKKAGDTNGESPVYNAPDYEHTGKLKSVSVDTSSDYDDKAINAKEADSGVQVTITANPSTNGSSSLINFALYAKGKDGQLELLEAGSKFQGSGLQQVKSGGKITVTLSADDIQRLGEGEHKSIIAVPVTVKHVSGKFEVTPVSDKNEEVPSKEFTVDTQKPTLELSDVKQLDYDTANKTVTLTGKIIGVDGANGKSVDAGSDIDVTNPKITIGGKEYTVDAYDKITGAFIVDVPASAVSKGNNNIGAKADVTDAAHNFDTPKATGSVEITDKPISVPEYSVVVEQSHQTEIVKNLGKYTSDNAQTSNSVTKPGASAYLDGTITQGGKDTAIYVTQPGKIGSNLAKDFSSDKAIFNAKGYVYLEKGEYTFDGSNVGGTYVFALETSSVDNKAHITGGIPMLSSAGNHNNATFTVGRDGIFKIKSMFKEANSVSGLDMDIMFTKAASNGETFQNAPIANGVNNTNYSGGSIRDGGNVLRFIPDSAISDKEELLLKEKNIYLNTTNEDITNLKAGNSKISFKKSGTLEIISDEPYALKVTDTDGHTLAKDTVVMVDSVEYKVDENGKIYVPTKYADDGKFENITFHKNVDGENITYTIDELNPESTQRVDFSNNFTQESHTSSKALELGGENNEIEIYSDNARVNAGSGDDTVILKLDATSSSDDSGTKSDDSIDLAKIADSVHNVENIEVSGGQHLSGVNIESVKDILDGSDSDTLKISAPSSENSSVQNAEQGNAQSGSASSENQAISTTGSESAASSPEAKPAGDSGSVSVASDSGLTKAPVQSDSKTTEYSGDAIVDNTTKTFTVEIDNSLL